MTDPDDAELRALRRRAYGRDADIHLDEDAQRRLRELESRQVMTPPPVEPGPRPRPGTDAVPVPGDAPAAETSEPEDPEPAPSPSAARRRWEAVRRIRPRRSTVLIALGAVLVIATLATLLVVVQRVQTDPLLRGAHQIARLSRDGRYTIPRVLDPGANGSGSPGHAYAEFRGLRSVVVRYADGTRCLSVYPQEDITDPDADPFEGLMSGGCAAGPFPATAQILLSDDGVPADIASAFPKGTALQFVYDRPHDEVVVFAAR